MSRQLVLRMYLYRMGRSYERWLKLATGVGIGGLVLTVLLFNLAPGMGQDWQMVFMGFCLVLTGMGHALLGEGVSLEEYATGDSDEMPTVAKLTSGLIASAGGLLIGAMGLMQVMG
ncbi:MAG: hypothetical protein ACOY94_19235 [Bacillota bacterium]